MGYTKHTWRNGDIINDAKLNHIEKGIEEISQNGGGLTDDVKEALLNCFEHVAWIDDEGQDYYDALEEALYSAKTLMSIGAVLNASGHTFHVGDDVNDIKDYLTVTATYDDSSTAVIPSASYILSGSLSEEGANTITVSYEEVTTTVSVTAEAAVELSSISAVYTQSGTVYTTDTLDSLKSDLVVTATYSDSSTATVSSGYTLSGTLEEGTSTITVTYGGKTATFNVTVSASSLWKTFDIATDFHNGIGLGTSRNSIEVSEYGTAYYVREKSDRTSYLDWDLLLDTNYTYRFEFNGTAKIGIPRYSSSGDNGAIAGTIYDAGWQDSGYVLNPNDGHSNYCFRMTLDGNLATVTSKRTTTINIYREEVSE